MPLQILNNSIDHSHQIVRHETVQQHNVLEDSAIHEHYQSKSCK